VISSLLKPDYLYFSCFQSPIIVLCLSPFSTLCVVFVLSGVTKGMLVALKGLVTALAESCAISISLACSMSSCFSICLHHNRQNLSASTVDFSNAMHTSLASILALTQAIFSSLIGSLASCSSPYRDCLNC